MLIPPRYYKRALCVDPNNAKVLCDYAVFLHTVLHDDSAAERNFRQALRVDREHVDSLGCYGMFVERVRGDIKEAHSLYLAALNRAEETGYGLVHWLERYEVFIGNHGLESKVEFLVPAEILAAVKKRIEKRRLDWKRMVEKQRDEGVLPHREKVRYDVEAGRDWGAHHHHGDNNSSNVDEDQKGDIGDRIADSIDKEMKVEEEDKALRQFEQAAKKKAYRGKKEKRKEKRKQAKKRNRLGMISLEDKNFIGQVVDILFRKCPLGPNVSSHKIALFHRETEKKLLELQAPNTSTSIEAMEELVSRTMGRAEFVSVLNSKRQKVRNNTTPHYMRPLLHYTTPHHTTPHPH